MNKQRGEKQNTRPKSDIQTLAWLWQVESMKFYAPTSLTRPSPLRPAWVFLAPQR